MNDATPASAGEVTSAEKTRVSQERAQHFVGSLAAVKLFLLAFLVREMQRWGFVHRHATRSNGEVVFVLCDCHIDSPRGCFGSDAEASAVGVSITQPP